MKKRMIFEKISMSITFVVFVFSLISPMYIFLGGNSLSNIVYGRIPGMDLRFGFFDRVAIIAFFSLLIIFFLAHSLSEKTLAKRLVCAGSFIYSVMYLTIITLVGMHGLVIFNFPIISIPLEAVLASKFFILIPAAYFFMIAFDKTNNGFVRGSAFFHAMCLVIVGIIKVFEMIFPVDMRLLVFDISTMLYLVSLSMVTFFMYRKYYE